MSSPANRALLLQMLDNADHEASKGTIKANPLWTSGDFALVSSDGERFRVDSTILSWAR